MGAFMGSDALIHSKDSKDVESFYMQEVGSKEPVTRQRSSEIYGHVSQPPCKAANGITGKASANTSKAADPIIKSAPMESAVSMETGKSQDEEINELVYKKTELFSGIQLLKTKIASASGKTAHLTILKLSVELRAKKLEFAKVQGEIRKEIGYPTLKEHGCNKFSDITNMLSGLTHNLISHVSHLTEEQKIELEALQEHGEHLVKNAKSTDDIEFMKNIMDIGNITHVGGMGPRQNEEIVKVITDLYQKINAKFGKKDS